MGYLKIVNLYKNNDIFMFKNVFATEKIHGCSTSITYKDDKLRFFSGGASYKHFVSLFDYDSLIEKFREVGHDHVVVYGEAYGGKMQGMSRTYGDQLKFIAFEVKIHDTWLNVSNAHDVVDKLGLDFVFWEIGPSTVEWLNCQRDAPSVQAKRNGIEQDMPREGIVIRPPIELIKSNGCRIIVKHKNDLFRETKTKRVLDPEKLKILDKAQDIANEWVTDNRLNNILSHIPNAGIENTGDIIIKMADDIKVEAGDEIVWSKEVRKAIGKKTATILKSHLC